MRRIYKLTPDAYWKLSEKQGGKCRICDKPEQGRRGLLHVDHNHTTGEIRGLLCQPCNLALGHFKDRVDLLESAILYLRG